MTVVLFDEAATDAADRAERVALGRRIVARELIDRASVRLQQAADAHSHNHAIEKTGDAADYLDAAGRVVRGSMAGIQLARLATRLRDVVENAIGHPSGAVLDEVADAADKIADALGDGL